MPADRHRQPDTSRLSTFTDGVVVVSMTLLVLDVRLPDNIAHPDGRELLYVLAGLWPKYFGYLLSFLVIAQYWLGYASKFGNMRAADSSFIWLNVTFLLVIGFIPFVTTLVTGNHGAVATSLYAATMVIVSSLLIAMWLYAIRSGLIESLRRPGQRWREVVPWIQIAAVFGLSIIVAQYNPRWARLTSCCSCCR